MSFGAPGGGATNIKPTPAVAFLLTTKVRESSQAEGGPSERKTISAKSVSQLTGECKHIIAGYLKCIKSNKGTNDEACRKLAKDYLACRMDK
ncbi:hypothetical protein N7510_007592 [Penicillium lagena]|uniref:uncharacterized protein n=1 Tax=Penicillium lagena TaxID=94218 RepID=UPI00254172EA|nr:uncharacterized protein N7510_007592 [Penicillium lagena]KAJ5610873.1 hypothetical protein N7510_007592 [Penicillium lagena]